MTLHELTHTILLLHRKPMSKIRLARVVYFVHKELIRKKLMQIEDIGYIRSPLGPVPDGFMTLAKDSEKITARRNASTNLSYAAEEYVINFSETDRELESTMLEQYRDILSIVERTLKALDHYATPELIEVSHHEPSWIAHTNGEFYYITTIDLKNLFPFSAILPTSIRIRLSRPATANKAGALQATLLRGMINDIVKESTDLEYPDDPNSNQSAPQKSPSHSKKITIRIPTIHFRIFKKNRNPQKTKSNPQSSHQNSAHSTQNSNQDHHKTTPPDINISLKTDGNLHTNENLQTNLKIDQLQTPLENPNKNRTKPKQGNTNIAKKSLDQTGSDLNQTKSTPKSHTKAKQDQDERPEKDGE